MLRRTCKQLANPFGNVISESPSFRAVPMRQGVQDVHESPYKEAFKEFWAQPVPWGDRDYGAKPKLGDPIPLRKATSMVVCAKNNHVDENRVTGGADNDYKVLMMHRHGKGRFTKDECLLPSATYDKADWDPAWDKVLVRNGVKTEWHDKYMRISCMRGLLTEENMLVLPKEHGGMAEVEGPPGPKKWHMVINSMPEEFRRLVDILELPMEPILQRLKPFRRVQTPETEMFRFDNHCYAVTLDKVPCVKYTINVTGEQLFWVTPKEALARVDAGLMEMPTPNIILLSELANLYPTFAEVEAMKNDREPEVILPELCYKEDNMSTILLPGDMHHSGTTPKEAAVNRLLRRIDYTKSEYFGTEGKFIQRVVEEEEEVAPIKKAAPRLLEEANEFDTLYDEVEVPVRKINPKDNMKTRMASPEFLMKDIDMLEGDLSAMKKEEDSSKDASDMMREAAGLGAKKSAQDLKEEEDRLKLKLINKKLE